MPKTIRRRRGAVVALAVALMLAVSAAQAQLARNVILMIGDGMGYQHVNAGSYYLYGQQGGLCFEPFYQCGAKTYSASSSVTDSAAAATAMATGVKVADGVISQAPDGKPLKTILEVAKDMGKKTGLVTTVPITHATPAGFGAHEASRNSYIAIGNDYLSGSRPNVVLGAGDPARGGSSYFSASQVTQAASLGYAIAYDRPQLLSVSSLADRVLGLFNGGQLTSEYDRTPTNTEPHLSEMASKALDLLGNHPDGFFLMIEGGLIDWAAHDNNIRKTTREVAEFHNACAAVLTWMDGRDDTLLIVTADHETGGLTATNAGAGNYPVASWSTGGHTGANVPVYATGAGTGLFGRYIRDGLIENTDIFRIMSAALVVPAEEGAAVASAKEPPVGAAVALAGKIVTAGNDQFASAFYVQDSDRAGGIRVSSTVPVRAGDRVDVVGTMGSFMNERSITASSVTVYPGPYPLPEPLRMPNRTVGGGALNANTPGVEFGQGLHNTGLLVKAWGRVTAVNSSSQLFAIDDGSAGPNPLGVKGLLVWYGAMAPGNTFTPPVVGQYLQITGISSRLNWGKTLPVIRPRIQADIVPE